MNDLLHHSNSQILFICTKYKMHRPTAEGFLKLLHERQEAGHYIALAKGKIEHLYQKWGFLRNID